MKKLSQCPNLDRPAWFLDFPKWQELRATAGNGVRKDSCVTFSQDHANRRQQRADKLKVKQVWLLQQCNSVLLVF